jgi:translation initiation factor 3 subunit A
MTKYSNQLNAVSLSVPDSLKMNIDSRFLQINTATELELWGEAYKSAEGRKKSIIIFLVFSSLVFGFLNIIVFCFISDLYALLGLTKKAQPNLLAAYYKKLAQIFWISNNFLFHAYAIRSYYNIMRGAKLNQDDAELLLLGLCCFIIFFFRVFL